MEAVRPEKISTTLNQTVESFFQNILTQIDQVQTRVLARLDESKNIKELESLLNTQRGSFGLDLEKKFETGKQELELCVQKGLYSTVV